MKVLIQRVKQASCKVLENDEYKLVSKIDKGLMLLVGFTHTDTKELAEKMAKKIVDLRIFSDSEGKMNLNIKQIEGKILSISQFTLYADTKKGNRPSFVNSMNPTEANLLYEYFNEYLISLGVETKPGKFGGDMLLEPLCDGPVTIEMEY